jgi:hypothetical protein
MTDASRAQGGLICLVAVVLGALFLIGVLNGSYWALAIPVTAGVLFVLGLAFWVGWTIATIQVEAETEAENDLPPSEGDGEPTTGASS